MKKLTLIFILLILILTIPNSPNNLKNKYRVYIDNKGYNKQFVAEILNLETYVEKESDNYSATITFD